MTVGSFCVPFSVSDPFHFDTDTDQFRGKTDPNPAPDHAPDPTLNRKNTIFILLFSSRYT